MSDGQQRRPVPPVIPVRKRVIPDREAIRAFARQCGFDVAGFARAELPDSVGEDLEAFVRDGRHDTMEWMAQTLERRRHPRAMWPEAVSVISLGLNYRPAYDPLALARQPLRGIVSAYARNRDYHDLIKKKLKQLARWLAEASGEEVKVFVDTAPLLEKPLATRAGLGWVGRHTNIVSRQYGSWLFLGEILTTLPLEPDPPAEPLCGSCRRCLDACPTAAIETGDDGMVRMDARRCIACLTIEHEGPVDPSLRPLTGNRIYGCDDCVAVCPWNRFAPPVTWPEFQPRVELMAPALVDLVQLDEAAFREVFAGSPIRRIGRNRLVRNVLTALGNSGDPSVLPAIRPLLQDEDAMVRDAAAWAMMNLSA